MSPITYLLRKILAHKLSLSCNRHHPTLAINALFISLDTLIPKPPAVFGLHILSQETKCWPLPHTKLRERLSSLSRVLTGRWIVLIECTGIDDSTAFVSVTLPARLRVCFFQPDNREATFSRTSPNVSLLILFCRIGIPKYFPRSLVDTTHSPDLMTY